MRTNGWERPFDPLQIVTWLLFPTLIIGYFVFFIPVLALETSIILGLLYGIDAFGVCYTAYLCGSTNPIDDHILQSDSEVLESTIGDDLIYCNVCMRYVDNDSRHCRVCDKCVSTFDHHCKWLNNCIGKKNYRYFLGVILSTLILTLVQFGTGIFLAVRFYPNSDGQEYLSLSSDIQFGIQIGFLALTGPSLYLITQLLVFHLRLRHERLTTYDYIVRSRRRRQFRMRELASGRTPPKEPNICCEILLCKKRVAEGSYAAPTAAPEVLPESTTVDRNGSPLVVGTLAPTTQPSRGFGAHLEANYCEASTPVHCSTTPVENSIHSINGSTV